MNKSPWMKAPDGNLAMDQHSIQGGLNTCFRLHKPGYDSSVIDQQARKQFPLLVSLVQEFQIKNCTS